MKKVIVIGGGAAGMMAACMAAVEGAHVTLLEKNEKTGKKIYITGKGRCNLTNACQREEFLENVITNPKFLYSAFAQLDNQAVMNFFEKAGCRLKTERGDRVFPVSDHSSDVIAALNGELKKNRVQVMLHTEVSELLLEEGSIKGVLLSDGKKLHADAVIIATGGRSYESTGSTGDGYRFAKQAGHTIKDLRPSLVPFVVKEEWCKKLQGLSLKNVAVTLKKEKKKIYEGFGEMLFTHFGVSGPLILSASSFYTAKYNGQEALLTIDLKPAMDREQLDKRILRDFEENAGKQFKNALDKLLPAKLIPVMVELSGIDPHKKTNEVTKKERSRLLELFKELKLTVNGCRGYGEAIITGGGVNVKEIDPKTMGSRLVNGLYFAGEVMDVDALTGGFNLQIAWSTGALAGKSAGEKIP
ncbi:nAD(FAD)-utilizing dehydrogenase [Firmicutes bacterium CAG:534]|nr:nAD(FAD)-utilizing dehydrogenase [Firmicutes bacterium CAG:534]